MVETEVAGQHSILALAVALVARLALAGQVAGLTIHPVMAAVAVAHPMAAAMERRLLV